MVAPLPFPAIDPVLISVEIGGLTLAVRWYALAYIAGILVGWRILILLMRRVSLWPGARPPMRPEQVEDLLTWLILGIVLGGRFGYVLFYQPGGFWAEPLRILRVWEGGMSFHGGFVGVVLASMIYARRHAIGGWALLSLADALALATPVGLFFGRLANFINAELWGRPTDLPWAVAFPGIAAQDCPGVVGICGRHPSQLYEAGLEGLLLGAVLLLALRAGWLRRPGALFGLFLVGYGAARFVVELFRQADAQFLTAENPLGHVLVLAPGVGLSMGQMLSLPMVLLGVGLIVLARPVVPR